MHLVRWKYVLKKTQPTINPLNDWVTLPPPFTSTEVLQGPILPNCSHYDLYVHFIKIAMLPRTTSCEQTRHKQDSNKLTGQFKSAWCIIYLEKCLQWSQNLAVINHFWALKYSHCKYTKPSFRSEGLLIPEKAGATTQLPNLARNCSSIIYFRSSKYAHNGHANLFLGTPRKSCKHVFVKCATIHAIVVSKKEPTLSQQVNSHTTLFPSSFTP